MIPVGLAILATKFVWARRLLAGMKQKAERLTSMVPGNAKRHPPRQEGEPGVRESIMSHEGRRM
ncbi:MAG: PGPGW domain-containing protein [candidate division NC10 bacterium]|nr:PGPGW domain-containing protein [candidate division NC10 bacterium]